MHVLINYLLFVHKSQYIYSSSECKRLYSLTPHHLSWPHSGRKVLTIVAADRCSLRSAKVEEPNTSRMCRTLSVSTQSCSALFLLPAICNYHLGECKQLWKRFWWTNNFSLIQIAFYPCNWRRNHASRRWYSEALLSANHTHTHGPPVPVCTRH